MVNILNELEEILKLGESSDYYSKKYNELINYCKSNNDRNTELVEVHHILPKCLGGTDDENNLVYMRSLEHIVAHCLLYLLYKDNEKIIYAAWCMLILNKSNNDRKESINLILTKASSIREEIYKSRTKPIVCLDENRDIVRIFPSTSSVKLIGIKGKNISSAIKGKRKTVAGYYWDYLDNYNNNFSEKVEKYIDNEKNGIYPPIRNIEEYNSKFIESTLPTSVLVHNNNYDVLKIFSTVSEAFKSMNCIGFSSVYYGMKNNKTSFSFYWKYTDEFSKQYKEKIDSYYKSELSKNNFIKLSNLLQFAFFDSNNNFLCIADTSFIKTIIDDNINLFLKYDKLYSYYKGYYIKRVDNTWENLEKLNYYYSINPKISQISLNFSNNIIRVDKSGTKSILDLNKDISHIYRGKILKVIGNKSYLFNDYYWYPLNYKFENDIS